VQSLLTPVASFGDGVVLDVGFARVDIVRSEGVLPAGPYSKRN
jgi:hypothetical protein